MEWWTWDEDSNGDGVIDKSERWEGVGGHLDRYTLTTSGHRQETHYDDEGWAIWEVEENEDEVKTTFRRHNCPRFDPVEAQ